MNTSVDRQAQEVENVLGEPVGLEFSENAAKVRRNLLLVGSISSLLVWSGATMTSQPTILGLAFEHVPDLTLRCGLLIVTVYLCIHFGWYVVDTFMGWRIRVTGSKLSLITGAKVGSTHGDYPDDPRQSSLYRWWVEKGRRVGNLATKVGEIDKNLQQWESAYRDLAENRQPASNLASAMSLISQNREQLAQLTAAIKELSTVMDSARIPGSLERFDRWFEIFVRSQNIRWLVIETSLPLLVGAFALFFLVWDIRGRY